MGWIGGTGAGSCCDAAGGQKMDDAGGEKQPGLPSTISSGPEGRNEALVDFDP